MAHRALQPFRCGRNLSNAALPLCVVLTCPRVLCCDVMCLVSSRLFLGWRCSDHWAAFVPRRIHVIAPRRVFLTWQHLVPTSFLRFMLFTSLAHFSIYSFSLVHKSHILSPGLNFLHSFIISHFKFGVGPQFLFHVNCDNAVLFRLVSVLKECLCWLNLLLKGSHVIPI